MYDAYLVHYSQLISSWRFETRVVVVRIGYRRRLQEMMQPNVEVNSLWK